MISPLKTTCFDEIEIYNLPVSSDHYYKKEGDTS